MKMSKMITFWRILLGIAVSLIVIAASIEDNIPETSELKALENHDDVKYYSQFHQDRFVHEHLFKDKRNGIFVDIGANDGVTFSNTYFFEKNLDWTGICIEPIPSVFQKLKENRKAKAIEGAVCNDDDFQKSNGTNLIKFLHIQGFSEMLSGIVDHYSQTHFARIDTEVQELNQNWEVFYVQCLNLTSILIENNLHHIDYMSIDIEGGELEILQSLNLPFFDISVIDVENDEKDPKIEEFMNNHGYLLFGKGVDDVYVKNYDSRSPSPEL